VIYLLGSLSLLYTSFQVFYIHFTISYLLIFLFIDYSYDFNEKRLIPIFYIFRKKWYMFLYLIYSCIYIYIYIYIYIHCNTQNSLKSKHSKIEKVEREKRKSIVSIYWRINSVWVSDICKKFKSKLQDIRKQKVNVTNKLNLYSLEILSGYWKDFAPSKRLFV